MAQLWPWLALAGLGGLHGLNPTSGWMLAAAWGLRAQDRRPALRALWPIGLGHALSVLLVALLVLAGSPMDRSTLLYWAGGLLLICVAAHWCRHSPSAWRAPAGQLGMGLWSFLMSSLHGAGLMVVPALLPLCMASGQEGGASAGSSAVLLAFAAVMVHGLAMLLVTGLVALGVVKGALGVRGRWKAP